MRSWTKALIAAGCFAFAVPALAAQPMQEPSEQGTMNQQTSAYPGVVKSIDQHTNKVTLEVPLAPGATIMRDGRTASLKDLKEGDDVRASFDPQTHKVIRLDAQSKEKSKMKNEKGTNY